MKQERKKPQLSGIFKLTFCHETDQILTTEEIANINKIKEMPWHGLTFWLLSWTFSQFFWK